MEMDMGNIAEVSYNPKFALITAAVFHARPFALVWIGWTLFRAQIQFSTVPMWL